MLDSRTASARTATAQMVDDEERALVVAVGRGRFLM
jgi:hypothetical protein